MIEPKKEHEDLGCWMVYHSPDSGDTPTYDIGVSRVSRTDTNFTLSKIWKDGRPEERITITQTDALFLSKVLNAWGNGEDWGSEDGVFDLTTRELPHGKYHNN